MVALTSQYIREEWKENIKNFKYRGSDNSIFYRMVVNPICNFIADHLPSWLPY
jgi:hypothetical protein